MQIEELKEQIQTLLRLIHDQRSFFLNLNRFEFPEKLQTRQQLEADIDAKRLTFAQQREELKAVKSAVDKASKADRKKRHGRSLERESEPCGNDQQIHPPCLG